MLLRIDAANLTGEKPAQSPNRRAPVHGFTLIELLTVIAIVAVLATIIIGVGRLAGEAGQIARSKAELAALSAALEGYKRHYGDYPQIVSDSTASSTISGGLLYQALNGQRGPLVNGASFAQRRVFVGKAALTLADPAAADTAANYFVDPWGNPYHYAYNTSANGWKTSSFVLFSSGPDGDATLPFPSDGIKASSYDEALNGGKPVNADNLYANQ